jgi:hypothetical protein
MFDVTRIPFHAKHINDSIFIEDLVKWHHDNVTLKNSDIMLISRQLLDIKILSNIMYIFLWN